MTATKIKVAYTLFLISFSIWLFLIGIALFPAVTTGNQIQFLNSAIQSLFIGSAATSTTGCLLIGVHLLGLTVQPAKQTGATENAKSIQGKLQAPQAATTIVNKMESNSAVQHRKPQEAVQTIGIIAEEEQEALIVKKQKK